MSDNNTIYIIDTLVGLFGLTENNQIIETVPYPKDSKQIAGAMERLFEGMISRELTQLVEGLLKRGFKEFVFPRQNLADSARKKYKIKTRAEMMSSSSRYLRANLQELAVEQGILGDEDEYSVLSHNTSIQLASRAVHKAQSESSATVTHMVQLLDELDKSLNVLSSKMREWHGLHFPELSRQVDSHQVYAKIVQTSGDRNQITVAQLSNLDYSPSKASAILTLAKNSMGAYLDTDDFNSMAILAGNILSLYDNREMLENQIANKAMDIAPNLSHLAGSVLAAKLIAKAGSLRKLAMFPASTIQLLGAEKALFRAKKTNAKPPKHGLIFQHPYVHSKPRRLRGRAARVLSSKLTLAARADAFTGNQIGEGLRKQLEEKDHENTRALAF